MKTTFTGKAVLCTVVLVGAMSAVALAEGGKAKGKEEEVKVAWKDVPAVVQATIQTNLNGAAIVEVQKENEDGTLVYEAKVKSADGKTSEIEVAADGKLIKIEAEDEDEAGDKGEEDDQD